MSHETRLGLEKDGYRCILERTDAGAELWSRRGASLTSVAGDGKDLRQIAGDDLGTELDRHPDNIAREMRSVLRNSFRALKQEQVIFHNLTTAMQASVGVHLPLPSDRLAGALDRLNEPAARLIVCAQRRSPALTWATPT
nr:hypothetical protein [Streptomyces chrestomyceticus]